MKSASLEHLIAAYSGASSANKTKFQKLKVVLARFHSQDIESILLKGADLIPRLYGVFGVRPMVDADLLVHEEDLPAIDRILRELSYGPQVDGNPVYVDPDYTLALDLVTGVWYLDDPAVIWERAVRRELEGVPVRAMGTNDLLIFLSAYGVVHRGHLSASFANDIALLVEKEDVDWNFVLDEASKCHLKTPIYHGLSFVLTRYPGAPIPDHVLRRLAPATLRERIWHWVLEKLVTDKPVAELGHLLLFMTQPGWKKWRWLKDRFSPSVAFLQYRYGDRWEAQPLRIRLCRPSHLLFQAVLLLTRIARQLIKGRV